MASVSESVEQVCRALARCDPRLGSTTLVCVDGPAGSGKSTLAAALAAATRAPVIHVDDMIAGWDGLPEAPRLLADLLAPLADDRAGSYQRYDWVAGQLAEPIPVEPSEVLLIEGVGSGSATIKQWISLLVWVDAAPQVRMTRGIERDGDAFRPYWHAWARAEDRLFAGQGTRQRADVTVWTSPI